MLTVAAQPFSWVHLDLCQLYSDDKGLPLGMGNGGEYWDTLPGRYFVA